MTGSRGVRSPKASDRSRSFLTELGRLGRTRVFRRPLLETVVEQVQQSSLLAMGLIPIRSLDVAVRISLYVFHYTCSEDETWLSVRCVPLVLESI